MIWTLLSSLSILWVNFGFPSRETSGHRKPVLCFVTLFPLLWWKAKRAGWEVYSELEGAHIEQHTTFYRHSSIPGFCIIIFIFYIFIFCFLWVFLFALLPSTARPASRTRLNTVPISPTCSLCDWTIKPASDMPPADMSSICLHSDTEILWARYC